MTDDLMNQAMGGMNALEKALHGVPGYRGYKEKELRRETDKTLRETVARQLMDQRGRLTAVQADLVADGQLSLLDNLERADRKLVLLADRIRTASYGYAPLFDDLRIKEAELDALARFDEALAADVSRVGAIIDNLTTLAGRPEQDWAEGIRALITALDTMNTDFGHRGEAIIGASAAGAADSTDVVPS